MVNVWDSRKDLRQHLAGSWKLPLDRFLENLNPYCELPPPTELLILLVDNLSAENKAVGDSNNDVGYLLSGKGWNNVRSFTSESALLASYPEVVLQPTPRFLWRANHLLEDAVQGGFFKGDETVLDVGSGSCRDAIYLAMLGCRVIATDQRETMLTNGRRMAKRLGLAAARHDEKAASLSARDKGSLTTLNCTFDSGQATLPAELLDAIGNDGVDVVHLSRFWIRSIFPALFSTANKAIFVHHFLAGSIRPVGDAHLLREKELRTLLEEQSCVCVAESEQWSVFRDQTLEFSDSVGLRRMSMFIATKTKL